MNWSEDQKTWSLNTFQEDDTSWCVKTVFLLYFFEGGDLKVQLSLSLKGVNIGMTFLLDRDQEGVKC